MVKLTNYTTIIIIAQFLLMRLLDAEKDNDNQRNHHGHDRQQEGNETVLICFFHFSLLYGSMARFVQGIDISLIIML